MTSTVNPAQYLQYFTNNEHRYVVELTVADSGVPPRSSKALVIVPLLNWNNNKPQVLSPVVIAAAVTLSVGSQLGILNAWDLDGDGYTFQPSSDSKQSDSSIAHPCVKVEIIKKYVFT